MSEDQEQVKKEQKSQSFFSRLFSREEEEEEHVISGVLKETPQSYQKELQSFSLQAIEVSTLRFQEGPPETPLQAKIKHGTRLQSDKKAERSKSSRSAAAKTQEEEDKARAEQIFFVMRSRSWDTAEERINRNLNQNEHTAVYNVMKDRQDVTGHDRRKHMKEQQDQINQEDVEADVKHLFENFRLDLTLDAGTPYDPDMKKIQDVYCANYTLVNPALAKLDEQIKALDQTDPANAELLEDLRARKHSIEDFSYPLMNLGLQNFARLEKYHRDVIACQLSIAQIQKEMLTIYPSPFGMEMIWALQDKMEEAQEKMDELKQKALAYINNPERTQYYDHMAQIARELRSGPKDENDPARQKLIDDGIAWYLSLPVMSPTKAQADAGKE